MTTPDPGSKSSQTDPSRLRRGRAPGDGARPHLQRRAHRMAHPAPDRAAIASLRPLPLRPVEDGMPICDCAHEARPFEGVETASRQPYRERATYQRRDGEALADDLPLCVNAGFCGTRTRKVWGMFDKNDPSERPDWSVRWSGAALPAASPSTAPTASRTSPPCLNPSQSSPAARSGCAAASQSSAADGALWEPRNSRVTVCRCGHSKNQPFCDKTHESIHFDER